MPFASRFRVMRWGRGQQKNGRSFSLFESRWSRAFWMLVLGIFLLLHPYARASGNFLSPDQAFHVNASMYDADTVSIDISIADGYYLYRDRLHFSASGGAVLGVPQYPVGQKKYDENFQKTVEIYHGAQTVRIPVKSSGPFILKIDYQGCAEDGLCYPPMGQTVKLDSSAGTTAAMDTPVAAATMPAAASEEDKSASSVEHD